MTRDFRCVPEWRHVWRTVVAFRLSMHVCEVGFPMNFHPLLIFPPAAVFRYAMTPFQVKAFTPSLVEHLGLEYPRFEYVTVHLHLHPTAWLVEEWAAYN